MQHTTEINNECSISPQPKTIYINKHIYNYSKHTTERYKLTPFNMSPVEDNVLPFYT